MPQSPDPKSLAVPGSSELPPIVERTVTVTRALRNAAGQLMERALADRAAGTLSKSDLLKVQDQYQSIIDAANRAVYEVTARLPPMANDFAQVEAATRQLEQALLQVRHFTETLVLTAKLLLAVGALVTLVLQPNPGTATATAAAIADVVKTIRDQAK